MLDEFSMDVAFGFIFLLFWELMKALGVAKLQITSLTLTGF